MTNQGFDMFNEICKALPREHDDGNIWSDGEKILCKTAEMADNIADLIDTIAGFGMTATGWYDPEEDKRTGMIDEYTGWHYVDC